MSTLKLRSEEWECRYTQEYIRCTGPAPTVWLPVLAETSASCRAGGGYCNGQTIRKLSQVNGMKTLEEQDLHIVLWFCVWEVNLKICLFRYFLNFVTQGAYKNPLLKKFPLIYFAKKFTNISSMCFMKLRFQWWKYKLYIETNHSWKRFLFKKFHWLNKSLIFKRLEIINFRDGKLCLLHQRHQTN